MESPSVLLSGMGGSCLGVWVAHAEGRVHFPDPASRKSAVDGALAPMRYSFSRACALVVVAVCVFFFFLQCSRLQLVTGEEGGRSGVRRKTPCWGIVGGVCWRLLLVYVCVKGMMLSIGVFGCVCVGAGREGGRLVLIPFGEDADERCGSPDASRAQVCRVNSQHKGEFAPVPQIGLVLRSPPLQATVDIGHAHTKELCG